jgi:hypothetical protein
LLSLILVEEKAVDTCRHTHTATACAWSHVVLVRENSCATPQQAKKSNANPKTSRLQLLSVAAVKPPTPHKERKQISPIQPSQTGAFCLVCKPIFLFSPETLRAQSPRMFHITKQG